MLSIARRFLDHRISLRPITVVGMLTTQIVLVVACVLAASQIRVLSERVEIYRKWSAPLVGRNVPPINGTDWKGASQTVEYKQDTRPTLIYSFTKNCAACRQNWKAMEVVQQLSPRRLRIIYVDNKDLLTEAYLSEHGLTRDIVFTKMDAFSEVSYQVRATPQAELVDKDGRVIWTNVGAFRPDDLGALVDAIEKHEHQSLTENKGDGQ